MEEHNQSPMASPSLHNNNNSSSSTIRFLGLLKQPNPDPNPNPFELDESDVIWSSDDDLSDSPTTVETKTTVTSNSSSPSSLNRHPFRHEKFGLSSVLSENNRHPLIQEKRAFNPSFSATTAARTIPPVFPVPRSGSSSDDFYNSSSGKFHQSAPVNVPVWSKTKGGAIGAENMGYFDEEIDGDEEMLPPHEIVARSHVTTFSVFEGVGRTLKGRDLRRVRNAIWQKTVSPEGTPIDLHNYESFGGLVGALGRTMIQHGMFFMLIGELSYCSCHLLVWQMCHLLKDGFDISCLVISFHLDWSSFLSSPVISFLVASSFSCIGGSGHKS